MSREHRIPLWLPIGALALALFAVGWLRPRPAQPPALVPGFSPGEAASRHATEPSTPPRSVVELGGTPQLETPITAPAETSMATAPIVLVHGRLRDASGATLPQASVSWVDAGGHAASVNQSEGTYITGGLAPGRWTATIHGTGIGEQQETLELAAQPALLEHDFVVEIRRRVPVALRTPDGTELEAALKGRKLDMRVTMRLTLVATREESPRPWAPSGLNRLPANTCGVYEGRESMRGPALPEGCCGIFEFRSAPPLWLHVVLGHERVASFRIEEIPERLELIVDPARVQATCGSVILRVIDPLSGTPLTGVGAMFGTAQFGGSMVKEGERLAARGIPPGAYHLDLTARGHCAVQREFVLAAGQELDLGDVPMPPTRPLKLNFRDGAGQPLEVAFGLFPLVPGDPRATLGRFQHSRSYLSDKDGSADLGAILPGKWVLIIDPSTGGATDDRKSVLGARPWILDAECSECPESTLVIEPTSELVLVPNSAAAIGLSFWIDTPEGLPAVASSLYTAEPRRLSLAPGPYTLTVEDPDGVELMRRPFDLGSAPLEIRLPR